jgi:hypothetical protein
MKTYNVYFWNRLHDPPIAQVQALSPPSAVRQVLATLPPTTESLIAYEAPQS